MVFEKKSDKGYRAFTSWDQLVLMLFGILSRCDSMSETCGAMIGLQGKLNQLGIDASVPKSTAGDGLRNRDNELFKDFYFELINHFKPLL